MSRPVFRHETLLGKFMAGLTSLALVSVSGSLILYAAGVLMGLAASAAPLVVALGLSLAYTLAALAFYSVSMFFSVASSRSSRSLLLSVVFFLVMVFLLPMIGFLVALTVLGPPPLAAGGAEALESEEFRSYLERQATIIQALVLVSPTGQASSMITPLLADLLAEGEEVFVAPVALLQHYQSAAILLAYTVVPFLASIAYFNRREEAGW